MNLHFKYSFCFLFFLGFISNYVIAFDSIKLVHKNDTIHYFKYQLEVNESMPDSLFIKQKPELLQESKETVGVIDALQSTWYYYKCYNPNGVLLCLPVSTMFPEIIFYQVENHKILFSEKIGFNSKFQNQTYRTLGGILPINNKNDTIRIFLKVKGLRFHSGFAGDIHFLDQELNADLSKRDKLVLISGIVLFAFCISFLLWIRMRENYYLFFSFFSLSYTLYLHTYYGTIRIINPFINYIVGYEYYAISYISMIIFIILYAAS